MFRQVRLIGALVRKDVKLFLADRWAAVMCFAVPIVLASAFGLIFDTRAQQSGAVRLPLYVVVEDDSALTAKIVADLQASEEVEVHLAERITAEDEINRHAGGVAVILPAGFGSSLSLRARQGEEPIVSLRHHPRSALECRWAEGVLTGIVMRRAAKEFLEPLGVNSEWSTPFHMQREPILASAGHSFSSKSHSFSGMTLQYLLFWGMECGLLLLRERQRGIWGRLQVSPTPLTTALLGRVSSTVLIALLQIATTFGFGYLLFGVTITGSIVGFVLLALAMSLLAAGVGLLVAAVGRTEASARSVFIVVILAVSMIGGLWLPAFLLPRWLQDWSLALPTSWAMRGLDAVTWQGRGLDAVWPSVLAVNSFALVFLAVAIARFHWSEARRRRGGIA